VKENCQRNSDGQVGEKKQNRFQYTRRRNDDNIANKHYSEHHKITEKEIRNTKSTGTKAEERNMDNSFQTQLEKIR